MAVVLPPYWLPPIAWFALASAQQQVVVGQPAFYRKQHYYNRALIRGPHRTEVLTVPIVHAGLHTPFDSALLAMSAPWPRQHLRTLTTCYRSSAFYEHYSPALYALLQAPPPSLSAFNLALLKQLVSWCNLPSLRLVRDAPTLLPGLTPGQQPAWFYPQPYFQCFGGFVPNLSILDLLFNLGPEAPAILRASYRP